MKFSQGAVDLIKSFEGFKASPYKDSVGIGSIGYGSTQYEDHRKVTMRDASINSTRASQLLLWHLNNEVGSYISKHITVSQNQHQIDAIASLVYNIGAGAFIDSTLLKKINEQASIEDIKAQWLRWNKAGGKEIQGLTNRRIKEFAYYIS